MLIVFVRVFILYATVLLVLRVMGKKQVGTLQPFELVTIVLIADIAAIPMATTGTPLINGLVGLFALLLAQFSLSFLTMKSRRSRAWLNGRPTIVVSNGKIIEDALSELRYSINDLVEQLRTAGHPTIGDVEFAILETSGQLSVIPKSQKRPATPADLGISTAYEGLPTPIIVDGEVDSGNLERLRLGTRWLDEKLKERGIARASDVLFATLDTQGHFYCQPKAARSAPNQ